MRLRAETAYAEPETDNATTRDTGLAGRTLPAARLAQALRERATAIAAQAGITPRAMGLCTALTVLWTRVHCFDAADARWPDRDRFVMSSATGTPLLYALLHLTGHPGMEQLTLDHCGELDAVAAGVAEHGRHPAIEASAAPGGQAIAAATGMALAERVLAARFGKSLVDHRVWTVCDATELSHGITYEAATLAGQLRLDRLVLLVDATESIEDARPRYASLGWAVKPADAGDPNDIGSALSFALRSRKPTLVWCWGNTTAAEIADDGSAMVLEAWRRVGSRGSANRRGWLKRIARHPQRPEFERAQAGRLPENWQDGIAALKAQLRAAPLPLSPADAAAQLMDRLVARIPEILCGRVPDTLPASIGRILPGQYNGRYVEYGHRPHAMAACANGIALHEGALVVTAATLAATADQMPALRLAALCHRRVIQLVFDAGLTGIGAAWQMPGLLAALRAVPRLLLFRPGDATETADCLEVALRRADGPSVLVLACHAPPEQPLTRPSHTENRCVRGGYVVVETDAPRQVTLVATGVELAVALAARAGLARTGIDAAVVSLPCWELFAAQDAAYRHAVLGTAPRVGVEAGTRNGWDRWLGEDALFIGCAEAIAGPADAVRQRLGLTGDCVAQAVRRKLAELGATALPDAPA